MATYLTNSLYVRNLSPQVTETMIREVFATVDEIERVLFRSYPNNEKAFFAQIDFKSSTGVSEGSKMNGTKILGVQCQCGVIDPVRQAELGRQESIVNVASSLPTDEEMKMEDYEARAAHVRKAQAAAEEFRLRTCHIAGLAEDTPEESIRQLCEGFGEVERLRIDVGTDGQTFGLVEFKEKQVAHVVKLQRSFLVEDRVLVFTEAKQHVDNCKVQEMMVQFQAPIIDAMNMKGVIERQRDLGDKLRQVRAAATELLGGGKKDKKKKKKEKKENKEKKEKGEKKEKEGKEKKEKKDKEKKKKKEKKQKETDTETQLKRPKTEADAEGAFMEEEEEEELVDLDEEVEVLAAGEVVGLMGTSSSSSSASDYGADALVELPMDVSKPDEVSDGDDVLCDAPTPLRPKGKGKGKGKAKMRPLGLGVPMRRMPRAASRSSFTGSIDLADDSAVDLG